MQLLSIIIPVYKAELHLDRCLASIVSQSYSALEIILVDDGSPDKSGEMCDTWAKKDSRIKVIHKENGGISSARNAGLAIATGEWIGFADDDDIVPDGAYEALMNATVGEKIGMITGNWYITKNGKPEICKNYLIEQNRNVEPEHIFPNFFIVYILQKFGIEYI